MKNTHSKLLSSDRNLFIQNWCIWTTINNQLYDNLTNTTWENMRQMVIVKKKENGQDYSEFVY